MRKLVRESWDKADKHMSDIQAIINHCLPDIIIAEIADEYRDMKEATDIILSIKGGGAMGVRVRSDGRYKNPYRDFTIRTRSNGSKTEIEKIREGYPDYYVYMWVKGWGGKVTGWAVIDMEKVRASGILDAGWKEKHNTDGITSFIAIPMGKVREAGGLIRWGFGGVPGGAS